ncbi:tyrosine-protein kinase receptor UFO, partial [Salmo trutta]|uniref:tyrosine-protein kinase receptor UFO n=1 Tax=Salmo trutta TaxID=8032 RepID=UPI0011304E71
YLRAILFFKSKPNEDERRRRVCAVICSSVDGYSYNARRPVPAFQFLKSPANVTLSLGKPVQVVCSLQGDGGGEEPPDVVWLRDGQSLDYADTNQVQVPVTEGGWLTISELRIDHVKLSDIGRYCCMATVGRKDLMSQEGHIQLEGIPHFSVKPHDVTVVATASLSLQCLAHGPPEPVRIIWLQNGGPLNTLQDPVSHSPYTLNITGLNHTSSFSCEAHNSKGVATSASGAVTVVPSQAQKVQVVEVTNSSLHISWEPGFGGVYPVSVCSIQAALSGPDLNSLRNLLIHNQNVNVPPAQHLIPELKPYTFYDVRVACRSSQGASPWVQYRLLPPPTLTSLERVQYRLLPPPTLTSLERVQYRLLPPPTLTSPERVQYRLLPPPTAHADIPGEGPVQDPTTAHADIPGEGPVQAPTTAHAMTHNVVHIIPFCVYLTVPEAAPDNVSGLFNGTDVIASWSKPPGRLNGQILGYRVEYLTANMSQAVMESVQSSELAIPLSSLLDSVSLSVSACTVAGCGPWSPVQSFKQKQPDVSLHQTFSWHWWKAFYPMRNAGGDFVVRYSAGHTYNRQSNEATLNSLVISDELKQKLQDVMVDSHKLTLGKTLGEGEFGSVLEGLLVHQQTVLKVAVKTLKISICTRTEMEDFLGEAACMKEFDHPNVMRLLRVCLQAAERGGYPSPVVILPYMKHGDLHSFLLYSRLGDNPLSLPSQMLVKFMTDIARGMEYLSNKRFIHRDLAARNCMLNENMTVCVADFGLSKKIYNGDYYRQGRISKMPVKWIAIESLADRVYTTKSDVWSFGVTTWEIATRGQTPYPGVENSEMYDYLRQGNRLKQLPGCLDIIYFLMFSCWLLSPKDRPGFPSLRCDLEKALEEMPEQEEADDLLYVNMEEPSGSLLGAIGGWEPFGQPHPSYWKNIGNLETIQNNLNVSMYSPQHEAQPYLNDRVDSPQHKAQPYLDDSVDSPQHKAQPYLDDSVDSPQHKAQPYLDDSVDSPQHKAQPYIDVSMDSPQHKAQPYIDDSVDSPQHKAQPYIDDSVDSPQHKAQPYLDDSVDSPQHKAQPYLDDSVDSPQHKAQPYIDVSMDSPQHKAQPYIDDSVDSPQHKAQPYLDDSVDSPQHKAQPYIDVSMDSPQHKAQPYIDDSVDSPQHKAQPYLDDSVDSPQHKAQPYIDDRVDSPQHKAQPYIDVSVDSPQHKAQPYLDDSVDSPQHKAQPYIDDSVDSPQHKAQPYLDDSVDSPQHKAQPYLDVSMDSPQHKAQPYLDDSVDSPQHKAQPYLDVSMDSPQHKAQPYIDDSVDSPQHKAQPYIDDSVDSPQHKAQPYIDDSVDSPQHKAQPYLDDSVDSPQHKAQPYIDDSVDSPQHKA